MAARLSDRQKRHRDMLRIQRIIETATARVEAVFETTPDLWVLPKEERLGSLRFRDPAYMILRPLARVRDAVDGEIVESCSG